MKNTLSLHASNSVKEIDFEPFNINAFPSLFHFLKVQKIYKVGKYLNFVFFK